MKRFSRTVLGSFAAALFTVGGSALASESAATRTPDFPPGVFSDNNRYSLENMEGKVAVLFFYEADCPGCRGKIPERNAVVKQFEGKPVKFFAIGPGDTFADVVTYNRGTKLAMPSFADTMGVMQKRYDIDISLRNIYQFRVIGPDGKIVGQVMDVPTIERALAGAKWKYKDGGYDPKLNAIVDALEWGQYEQAMRALKVATKSSPKSVAESATKLYDVMKAEGKTWLEAAEAAKESEPVKAYDLFARTSACFAGDELAKTADAGLKALKTNKAVVAELAARNAYNGLSVAMTKAGPNAKPQLATAVQSIAKKYADTPTGQKAAALATELGAVASAEPTGMKPKR